MCMRGSPNCLHFNHYIAETETDGEKNTVAFLPAKKLMVNENQYSVRTT